MDAGHGQTWPAQRETFDPVGVLHPCHCSHTRRGWEFFYVSDWFAVQRLKNLSKEIASMDQTYYDFTVKMEKEGVNDDYVQGWQSGYILNPPREEQRTSEAYEAGYEDGKAHNVDNYSSWK
jgi:hypothetical protein